MIGYELKFKLDFNLRCLNLLIAFGFELIPDEVQMILNFIPVIIKSQILNWVNLHRYMYIADD